MDSDILLHIIATARKTGDEIISLQKSCTVEEKGSCSPVTNADLRAQKIILDELANHDYPILSEHMPAERIIAKRFFVVDPIDGTEDYLNQGSEYAISITLFEYNDPLMAVVFQPAKNNLYYAQKGKGAFCQAGGTEPHHINVSRIIDESNIRFSTTKWLLDNGNEHLANSFNIFKRDITASFAVALIRIAQGDSDLMIAESFPEVFSFASGLLILQESGGKVSDLSGAQVKFNHLKNSVSLLASNGFVHEHYLEKLNHLRNN